MSRFALLKIENDDLATEPSPAPSSRKNSAAKNAKGEQQAKKNKKKQMTEAKKEMMKNLEDFKNTDWDEWKKKDEQFTEQMYREHLKAAMIESKIDFESKKIVKTDNNIDDTTKNKPAKPAKPIKMSLEEFHRSTVSSVDKSHKKQVEDNNVKILENTEKFIDDIDKNLDNIILRDNIKSNSTRDNAPIDKFLALQYKDKLEKRDNEIRTLNQELDKLKDELNQSKKRNKQLAFILAQGEMKEKAELLLQIDELNAVKDELSAQITELHKNLEVEKSKVHQLENEAKKHKQKV